MIRVLIVDDHPVVRQGLVALLSVQGDIEVAGEAGDGRDAVSRAGALAPDVVLLDLKLPGLDGVAVLGELAGRYRVLVLTSATDQEWADRALQAGASGVVYKDIDPDALVRAIRSVHDGNVLLAVGAAAAVRRGPAGRRGPGWQDALTPREREVLGHITAGRSNREIARALGVSEKTVKAHVSAVLGKLGVQDRTQAAVLAIRSGT